MGVEQMVDCDDFSHACAGGSPETAYDELTIGGGITTAVTYGPYIGNKTEKCHFKKSTAVVAAPDYPSYKNLDGEDAMLKQIHDTPIAVCVQADLWKSYTGGVIKPNDGCG